MEALNPYIIKVHLQVGAGIGLHANTLEFIGLVLGLLLRSLLENYSETGNMNTTLEQILMGDILTNSKQEVQKAKNKFNNYIRSNPRTRKTRSAACGLTISVIAIENIVNVITRRTENFKESIELACVLEYILAEILEMSGNTCRHYDEDAELVEDPETGYSRHIMKTDVISAMSLDADLLNIFTKIGLFRMENEKLIILEDISNRIFREDVLNIELEGFTPEELNMIDLQAETVEQLQSTTEAEGFITCKKPDTLDYKEEIDKIFLQHKLEFFDTCISHSLSDLHFALSKHNKTISNIILDDTRSSNLLSKLETLLKNVELEYSEIGAYI